MPCFYHATSWRNAESIDSNGFVIGWGGLAGPGVYVCETEYGTVRIEIVKVEIDCDA